MIDRETHSKGSTVYRWSSIAKINISEVSLPCLPNGPFSIDAADANFARHRRPWGIVRIPIEYYPVCQIGIQHTDSTSIRDAAITRGTAVPGTGRSYRAALAIVL